MFWPPLKCHILSFITRQSSLLCKFYSISDEQLDTYHFTDLSYADDAAILLSDQLQAESVLQSFNAFATPLGRELSWLKTKLQNVGVGEPPSTILIGVPVEGVEEFIYLGSKQSSNWLLPTGRSTQNWTVIQWWILYRGHRNSAVSVSTPKYTVPSTGNVYPALWCRNMDHLGRLHEYTGGFSINQSINQSIKAHL